MSVDSACVRILWKLRQQRWLEDGSRVCDQCPANVLVKMNMFRTRCMLFYFDKTIEFVSWGNIFPFCLHLFLRTFQHPNPFCYKRSTANLLVHDFLSQQNTRPVLFLSEFMDLIVAGRDQSAADRPKNLAEGQSSCIVTIKRLQRVIVCQTSAPFYDFQLLAVSSPNLILLLFHLFLLDVSPFKLLLKCPWGIPSNATLKASWTYNLELQET
jgi:hypothetical protein